MSAAKDFQTMPLSVFNMKYNIRVPYFGVVSAALLFLIVYFNTSIAFNEQGLKIQLLVVVPMAIMWFGLVGFSLRSAIFASVALCPATLLWGVGFLKLPGMALTLSDLFTIISVGLFLAGPKPLYRNNYTSLIWLFFTVCVASVLLADIPEAYIGQLLRLGLSIGLISIVLSSRGDTLKKPFLHGMLLWPFVALSFLAGVGGFWRFISFSDGAAFNPIETGEVLLGSHQVVVYLFFLFPFLLLTKRFRMLILIVLSWLGVLVVFSYSRSLVIGVGVSVMFYLLFIKTGKRKIIKFVFAGVLSVCLVLGVVTLGFFTFSKDEGLKSMSSNIRITKMLAAWNTFTENPVLGIGYGSANVIDTGRTAAAINAADPHFMEVITDVKASAEFTPSQILAETGLAGGLISLFLIILSFKCAIHILKNTGKPIFLKITLTCAAVFFITSFLGGNAFASLVFWLAVPFILDDIKLTDLSNSGRISKGHAVEGSRSYE